MKKIFALILALVMVLSLVACDKKEYTSSIETYSESTPGDQTSDDSSADTDSNNDIDYIDDIVNKYNTQASEKLVFVEDFTPSDRNSGHYRTEFRLLSFEDAIGKSYLLGDKVVDIVASQPFFNEVDCRVYTNDTSLDQVIALVQGFAPILDQTLTAEELQTTISKISTQKTANYYFGKLGITLFGNDTKGYELMLKAE